MVIDIHEIQREKETKGIVVNDIPGKPGWKNVKFNIITEDWARELSVEPFTTWELPPEVYENGKLKIPRGALLAGTLETNERDQEMMSVKTVMHGGDTWFLEAVNIESDKLQRVDKLDPDEYPDEDDFRPLSQKS